MNLDYIATIPSFAWDKITIACDEKRVCFRIDGEQFVSMTYDEFDRAVETVERFREALKIVEIEDDEHRAVRQSIYSASAA